MRIDDVKEDIRRSVLCWLATVDAEGQPNVSPKEIFLAQGEDTVLIAGIASPGSVRNIHANPKVCVSLIDVFRQKGSKLIGMAEVIEPDDPAFPDLVKPLRMKAGPGFPIRWIIRVRVTGRQPIVAPSYALFPDQTEEEQVRSAHETYGVRPR